MKLLRTISILITFFITLSTNVIAQDFSGNWSCDYATFDDPNTTNSTGNRTISVAVIKQNTFVALVRRGAGGAYSNTNYLVGYSNADSVLGRMGHYLYGDNIRGYRQEWMSGFDAKPMIEAFDLAATPDSLIYVANNDPERNILVFRMSKDSVISTNYRIVSGADSLWAIDVDGSGRVYVSSEKDSTNPGKILIFGSIKEDNNWEGAHTPTPLYTITLPEPGSIRGITVSPEGTVIYASNYTTKKIYCYTGNPQTGYNLYNGFNFTLTDSVSNAGTAINPGPWGINFMKDKNILFVAADVEGMGTGYEYARIYALDPNTGKIVDTIDCAKWNYEHTNQQYNDRGKIMPGRVSGYASVRNVDFDENNNVYEASYYAWAIDKWSYSGTLPTIKLVITGIEKEENFIPDEFELNQNYPNPFNPSTTIEFSLNKDTEINLSIYSITGELVSTLIKSSYLTKGKYKLTFNASKLASGTYIYLLKTNTQQLSKKMTLIK